MHAAVFERWVETDPASAVGWAQRLLTLPASGVLGSFRWDEGADDPGLAHQARVRYGHPWGLVEYTASQWALKDAEKAFAWAEQLPAGLAREVGLPAVVKAVAHSDLERALSLLDRLGDDSPGTREAAYGVIELMAERDPERAWTIVGRLQDDSDRRWASGGFVAGLARKNLDAARQWVEELPAGDLKSVAANALVQQWVKQDLSSARQWAESLAQEESGAYHSLLSVVASSWALREPEAAGRWMAELSRGKKGLPPWHPIARELAYVDAAAATIWAQQLPEGDDRHKALETISEVWASRDPEAARAWISRLPENERREGFDRHIVLGEFQQLAGGDNSLGELLAKVEDLPEDYRQEATGALLGYSRASRGPEIVTWLQTRPHGETKDQLISTHLTILARGHHPEVVVQMLEQIQDEKLRFAGARRAVGQWNSRDRTLAAHWVPKLSLPEELKEELLKSR